MIIIIEIDMEEAIKDFSPLVTKHWVEVARNQDKIELAPDWEKYKALYDEGHVLAYGAYKLEGQEPPIPVGYTLDIISPSLHYMNNVFAQNDVIFVSTEMRNTSLGYKLIAKSEDRLRKLGVDYRTLHMKYTHDFSKLTKALGYEDVEKIVGKYLGD